MIATRAKIRAETQEAETLNRACEAEGCAELGAYRAPKSRSNLREFRWFCLAHVREYNSSWDFYKGMSPGEIEEHLRSDTMWQRPTWPLGRLGHSMHAEQALEEELKFTFGTAHRAPVAPKLPSEVTQALDVLGLPWPISLRAVKAQYKKLAKRYHPDANNGDKKSEELFKSINLAYKTLSSKFADLLLRDAPNQAG